jgi:hypothetical protein
MKRKLRLRKVSRSTILWTLYFIILEFVIWVIPGPIWAKVIITALFPFSLYFTWTSYYKEEIINHEKTE